MSLILQIGIGALVGLIMGFIVGYFVWFIIRWQQKKKAIERITKQNLKFKNCEFPNLQGAIQKNEIGQTNKEIERTNRKITESQRTDRKDTARFGRIFRK